MTTKTKAGASGDKKWRDGPPPHAGWWNASRTQSEGSWRWWNGQHWSAYVSGTEDAESAGDTALHTKAYVDKDKPVQWRYFYPKNARVPRVDPTPKLKIVVDNAKHKKVA